MVDQHEASDTARRLSASWCRDALSFPPFEGREARRDLSADLRSALEQAFEAKAAPEELARVIRRAQLP